MPATGPTLLIPVLGQEPSLQRHTGRPPETKEHFSGKLSCCLRKFQPASLVLCEVKAGCPGRPAPSGNRSWVRLGPVIWGSVLSDPTLTLER